MSKLCSVVIAENKTESFVDDRSLIGAGFEDYLKAGPVRRYVVESAGGVALSLQIVRVVH